MEIFCGETPGNMTMSGFKKQIYVINEFNLRQEAAPWKWSCLLWEKKWYNTWPIITDSSLQPWKNKFFPIIFFQYKSRTLEGFLVIFEKFVQIFLKNECAATCVFWLTAKPHSYRIASNQFCWCWWQQTHKCRGFFEWDLLLTDQLEKSFALWQVEALKKGKTNRR